MEPGTATAKYCLKDGFRGEMPINNLTERGIGCRSGSAPLSIGDEISLELPSCGTRVGIVRWVKDGNCGIEMMQ